MVVRQNWAKLIMVSSGASHCLVRNMSIVPKTPFHIIHNKKLPSWASQMQLSMYFGSRLLLECSQAKLYSK